MIAFGTWTTNFNRKLKPFWLKSPLLLLLERNLVQIDNLARPRLTRFLHDQMMSTTSPQMMQLLRIRMGPPCPT